jgi:hypothetical protein
VSTIADFDSAVGLNSQRNFDGRHEQLVMMATHDLMAIRSALIGDDQRVFEF